MSIVSIYSFMVLTLKRTSTHFYQKTARLRIFSLYISVNGQDETVLILCFHDRMLKDMKYHTVRKLFSWLGDSVVCKLYITIFIMLLHLAFYHILQKIVVYNFNLTMYVFTIFVVVILLSIHQSHLNLMARKKIDYSYKRISIESIKTILIFLFHNLQAKHFLLHFLTAKDICLPVYGRRRNFSMHVIRSLLMCNILYHQCGLSNSMY